MGNIFIIVCVHVCIVGHVGVGLHYLWTMDNRTYLLGPVLYRILSFICCL